MWNDRLNDQRHKLSSLGSLLMVGMVWSFGQSISTVSSSAVFDAIELTTTQLEPAPKTLVNIRPVAIEKSLQKIISNVASLPPSNHSIFDKHDSAPPAPSSSELVKPSPPTTVTTVVAQAPMPEPIKTTTPAPAPVSSANIEASFVVTLRALLNENKRYPTGREASLQRPSGKAKVWFVLTRSGSLQEAGIEDSSHSIILDSAALATVRRTQFSGWPEGSWPRQMQHRFTVTLDFTPVS